MSENPFVVYNQIQGRLIVPKFPRDVAFAVRISSEALPTIHNLIHKYTHAAAGVGLSHLTEAIGLGALVVKEQEVIQDPDSGVTTEDCREAGYLDGLHGDSQRFLLLFGHIGDEFQQAYLRGFFEGNYMRNKNDKTVR